MRLTVEVSKKVETVEVSKGVGTAEVSKRFQGEMKEIIKHAICAE